MGKTKIEWTEHTWNPVTGCTKVSPGCKNCYAEGVATRLQSMGAKGYENAFKLTLQPQQLKKPLTRKKPTMYFVNSMSDLFHEDIPISYKDEIFDVIWKTPQHTYQILTKRVEIMFMYFRNRKCPPNVWLGVSVEDRMYGLPRIDWLRKIDAPIRFLSIEPLLEDLGNLYLHYIDWVIVGGESGPNARRMHKEWILNVKLSCEVLKIPFFFKQWGSWGEDGIKRPKHLNGRLFQGHEHKQYPDPSNVIRDSIYGVYR